MATLVLGAVGAAVGYFVGGPTGAQIGFSIGSAIGGGFGSSGEDIKTEGARLSDLKVQTSSYGSMIPIYYGIERGTGNVIWSTDLLETAATNKSESGGKGGGGGGQSVETTTYTYRASFAVSIADTYKRNPIGILRVWANNLLILDLRPEAIQTKNFDGKYRVYLGGENQEPSSLQESYLGVGNVPAYRGQLVIEFEDMQLAKFGNRIPNISVEVVMGADTTLSRPTNTDTGGVAQNFKITRGGLNQGFPFALNEDNGGISFNIGNYNLDTNSFIEFNTITYAEAPRMVGGFGITPFDSNYNPAFINKLTYYNPVTLSYEQKLVNRIYLTSSSTLTIFNAETYSYINTWYTNNTYGGDNDFDDMGIPFLSSDTLGTVFYNDVLQRVLMFKQNPAIVGCYLIFSRPMAAFFSLEDREVVFAEGPLAEFNVFSDTPFIYIPNALNDDRYAQAYVDEDLIVGFRASTFGFDYCPISVSNITQTGVYTPFFTANINSKQNNGVVCIYDTTFNRLLFISINSVNDRLTCTYFNIARDRVDLIPDIKGELSDIFQNNYTYDSTPIEQYITDSDGNFITGIAPEPNLGGMTRDGTKIWFSTVDGINKGPTYNVDLASLKVTSISLPITSGATKRGGEFYPVFSEPAFNYKNLAITVESNSSTIGITRVPQSPNYEGGVTLASVVQNISSKVGMQDKVDVTELQDDIIYGYKIGQIMTARNAIETLQRGYQFDSVESTE